MRFPRILAALAFLFVCLSWSQTVSAGTPASDGHDSGHTATHETSHEDDHASDAAGHHGHANLGETLPLWGCIPFACMLLSIALMPLLLPNFWHHHFGKVSAFWAACLGSKMGGRGVMRILASWTAAQASSAVWATTRASG